MSAVSTPNPGEQLPANDVAVIGGGPAGLSAALWSARYRRRVLLVDGGRPPEQLAERRETHGYLAMDGIDPSELLDRARKDLLEYPEVTIVNGTEAVDVATDDQGFEIVFDDGRRARALRLILATGVVDILPDIDRFGEFFGSSAFTCPSCDGYEAQDKAIVVIGDDEHLSTFAIGMLDWASTVTLIIEPGSIRARGEELDKVRATGIQVVVGRPTALLGQEGVLEAIRLADGSVLRCQMLFCTVGHEHHSDLAKRLGCKISDEGCVVVDDQGCTSVPNVYAAGDMTPGFHLVQLAAADGARAGIAAALSLRGERGALGSPRPAPDASSVLGS